MCSLRGCSIQTGAREIVRTLRVPVGDAVGVCGLGAVGLTAVMAARVARARSIIAVNRDSARIALAHELGATSAVDTRETDVLPAMREEAADGLDVAGDTTGSTKLIRTVVTALTAQGGVCVTGATPGAGAQLTFDYRDVLLGGNRIIGIIEGDFDPQRFVPELVDLFRQGRLPADRTVTHYPTRPAPTGTPCTRSCSMLERASVVTWSTGSPAGPGPDAGGRIATRDHLLLTALLSTDHADVGWDAALAVLDVYAELIDSGGPAEAHDPGVAMHLVACGPCKQDLHGLLARIAADDA